MNAGTLSHPAWVCGLKPPPAYPHAGRTIVTPCVGVWIETTDTITPPEGVLCHTLRGCVD